MSDKTLLQILEEHVSKIKTREDYDELKLAVDQLVQATNSPSLDMAPNTGLTIKEDECMTHLAKAFNAFNQLPVQRKHDLNEFVLGIHQLQRMIAIRYMRRSFPNYWLSELSTDDIKNKFKEVQHE
jgi:hypothetical protein